jgi:O-antigen/teichoic acid export membrane protein
MKFKDLLSPNQLFALLAKGLEGTKVIVASIIVARFYGPEDFGRFAFIIGVTSIVAIIAEFRLQSVLVKELSLGALPKEAILGSALTANFIFAAVGMLGIWVYTLMESDRLIATGLLIYSLIFIYKIPRAFRSQLISNENNKSIAKCEAVSSIISISAMITVSTLQLNLLWVLFARSLDFLFISIFFITLYKKQNPEKLKSSFQIVKKLSYSSAPLVFSGAAMILFQRADLIIIKTTLGEYATGLYSSATTLMLLFSLAPMVISESLAPKIFRNEKLINSDEARQKFSDIIIFIGLAMSALMLVCVGWGLPYLYGAEYQAATYSAYILSACPALISLGAASGQLIVADDKQGKTFIKSLGACLINLIMNFLLIPTLGIEGAAISTVCGLALANYMAHGVMPTYHYIFKIQNNSLVNLMLKGLRFSRSKNV